MAPHHHAHKSLPKAKNFGKSKDEAITLAKAASKSVGISDEILAKSPFNLSGGQMRRVAIAGILASDPDILVLDEPTVGLDPRGKVELMEMLVDIQKNTGKSIIIITHDMNLVAKYAKRCIVLNNGNIVYDGPKKEMFQNTDFLLEHNLDIPDITKLANSLKNRGLITFKTPPLTEKELFNIITRGEEYE